MPLWMLTDMVGVFIGALECFACLRLDSLLPAQGIFCDRIHAALLPLETGAAIVETI